MSSKRVLIVDDNPVILELLSFLIRDLNCEVFLARDGIEAIEKVYEEGPDLILLDILMPKMNGYQVCRLLKDNEDTRHIPVIMLTAKDQLADQYWGFMTGADEYIIKDFERNSFIERIKNILESLELAKERTPRKKSRHITPLDILSQVNDLLDRKLYHSTIINEINQLAASMQNFEETLKSIFQLLSRIIEFQIGVISIMGTSGPRRVYTYAREAIHPSLLTQIYQVLGEDLEKGSIPYQLKGSITEHSPLQILSSHCKVPLVSKGAQIGSILLGDYEAGKLLEGDQNILRIVAKEAAVVIDNARLYDYNAQLYSELEKEILQISNIQKSLLPQTNPMEQLVEIQSSMIPSREVGGDYYDYFPLSDHELVVTIGDVTGKGAPASLLMAMVKTALQVKMSQASEICEVLSYLNQFVRDRHSDQYMTLFLGVLDLQEGTFSYVNAGHNFPYLISPSAQKLQFLEPGFLPLGLEESPRYLISRRKIAFDEFLFFYTDGVVEAMDVDRRLFGYERLEEVLLRSCQLPLEQIRQRVLESVQGFCGNTPLRDDMTLLLIQSR